MNAGLNSRYVECQVDLLVEDGEVVVRGGLLVAAGHGGGQTVDPERLIDHLERHVHCLTRDNLAQVEEEDPVDRRRGRHVAPLGLGAVLELDGDLAGHRVAAGVVDARGVGHRVADELLVADGGSQRHLEVRRGVRFGHGNGDELGVGELAVGDDDHGGLRADPGGRPPAARC